MKLMKLKLDRQVKKAEIMLYLIDYNPNSTLGNTMIEKASQMGFADQIRIAYGGLALWDQSSEPVISKKKDGRGE